MSGPDIVKVVLEFDGASNAWNYKAERRGRFIATGCSFGNRSRAAVLAEIGNLLERTASDESRQLLASQMRFDAVQMLHEATRIEASIR